MGERNLNEYTQKRDFAKTAEPEGGRLSKGSSVFVIQKHDASSLHYDFRLEIDGVLKSWVVPKGSAKPSEYRTKISIVRQNDR